MAYEEMAETEPVESPAAVEPEDKKDPINEKIEKRLSAEVKDAKSHRRTYFAEWKRNIQLRLGRPEGIINSEVIGTAQTEALDDENRSEINPDWWLTKTKTANLISQVPAIRGTHENKKYAQAVPPFMKELNYQLGEKRANIAAAMEESVNDAVNASAIAGVLVGYTARFEKALDPKIPPEAVAQYPPDIIEKMVQEGTLPSVPRVVSDKFFGNRVSPTDLLWPKMFKGSDFNMSPWVGYTGEKFKAEAKVDFKLTDEQLNEVGGKEHDSSEDDMRVEPDRAAQSNDSEKVYYDHLFYWRYLQDPDELNMKAIWEIIYVHGLQEPVYHGPSTCQRLVAGSKNQYVGACKYPLQILTLTYVTDNPVPPSDSAAGRPQVNDLRRSRSQMFANRARSTPLRWYDVNRVNKDVQMMLMRGDIQGFIPTNGSGEKVIGEIARASYPAEDNTFDRTTMSDLMAMWQIGPNQAGTIPQGERTKAEVELTQGNFSTRMGQERGRVAQFLINIAEVMAAYIALYSDFKSLTDQERQTMMSAWNGRQILTDLVMTIRPDSTVLLDSEVRFNKLNRFLNMTVKSGFVNPLPILAEMAELSGLDPSEVIVPPKPQQPKEDVNISYRFSGKDDLMNPTVIALLKKENKLPSLQDLAEAKKFLEAALQTSNVLQPQMPPMGGPTTEEGPMVSPAGGLDAHPEWQLASKVAQRSEDAGVEM